MNTIVIRAAIFALACVAGLAYGQTTSLDKYKGVWLTTDKSIKIVLTVDSDPNRINLAYFNKPDFLKTPYTRTACATQGQADGIVCEGGLWFALRSDGKLATSEESHPPQGGTVYYLFEKVGPK